MEDLILFLNEISSFLSALATIIIAIFAYEQHKNSRELTKLNEKMNWFTGAMKSHSNIMMMLEAEKQGKKMIYWDPDYRDVPFDKEHGDEVDIKEIKIFIPQKHRLKERAKS